MVLEMEVLFMVTKVPHIALDALEHGEIGGERRGKYFEKLSRNRDLDLALAARNTLGGPIQACPHSKALRHTVHHPESLPPPPSRILFVLSFSGFLAAGGGA
jgi:hypothetical protein